MSRQKRMFSNQEMIGEKQYEQKIPFFVMFLTGVGVIGTIVSFLIVLAFNKTMMHFGILAITFNLIAYKLFAPRWTELEEVYLIKLFYATLKKIRAYSHQKVSK